MPKMSNNINDNPFAGLFPSTVDAVSLSVVELSDETEKKLSSEEELLREVFGVTSKSEIDDEKKRILVHVEADSPEHAVFERLMLTNFQSRLIPSSANEDWIRDDHTVEREIIPYLFECFCRLRGKTRSDARDNLERITISNASTALQAPDCFPEQKVHEQFASLFKSYSAVTDHLPSFVSGITSELGSPELQPDDETVDSAFSPILDIIYEETKSRNILTFCHYWFDILQQFSSIECLAKLIIRHSEAKSSNGRAYADTLLGSLLSFSCLPKNNNEPFMFFTEPLERARSANEENMRTALVALTESLHLVFHSLLKCSPEVRHMTLKWLGNCLEANASRGKLWNSQSEIFTAITSVSDGFMLNLGTVMLRLCKPFGGGYNGVKALKIDPTYCAAEPKTEEESRNLGVHIKGMSKETCLVPITEGETRLLADNYGFVTECFFLTHRALDLGFRVVLEKLQQSNQEMARTQRLYTSMMANRSASSIMQLLDDRMGEEMTKYKSMTVSLLVPETLDLLAKFHATTAFWLVQVYLDVNDDYSIDDNSVKRRNYSPRELTDVKFPLPERVPDTVKCIPEFIVENTVGFICFLKRFSPNTFEEQGTIFLNPILTEIIVLMGSPQRLYNPHLRARLAEGLEALLPFNDDKTRRMQVSLGTFYRKMLFAEHPYRQQIVANLLHVFVSIEMTGQSVQFEQKFNYRRPMYIAMGYLWDLDEHKNIFKNLAEEAEKNMEAVEPPLFLRFINLLMNDAVFLLDEALTNMAQLKQMIQARERGEWNKLPQQEREQQASYLEHIGMIARFDNILGRETINMLKMLTTEIKSIFCHSTMVDRIASMLNYLLLHLVGPNQRDIKVKDQQEYEFNPANLVLNICEIYINLSQNENFTLAVSQDGRSYRSELFGLAENVLVRIGGVGIIGDLDAFANRVKYAAHLKKKEDEILNNAPDDYLDPIMSTLMTDPVVLPSSKQTVDRQTIARHLLSDQTDPFNRSPLTMDMVKSDTELQRKIQNWIKEKKGEKSSDEAPERKLSREKSN